MILKSNFILPDMKYIYIDINNKLSHTVIREKLRIHLREITNSSQGNLSTTIRRNTVTVTVTFVLLAQDVTAY